jgi:selenocysteine-specific elongation factor
MKVIGTAGHVDHGKSQLVLALTGINPDRLKEEQERQMTIDLGFAWLTLPAGEQVGIIDVPGHRDFIENMLAGVGGIDAAMLVVAADEGVMPQTREHLAILDLLSIERCVVCLSKIDLVQDPEWRLLVRDELEQLLADTSLKDAPIVEVSALTGEGLDSLVHELERALTNVPERNDIQKPRLPVDRAFTISGFGTVVTGTLVDGKLETGKEVILLPSGAKGRVRGLQTHKTKVEQAIPGSRVALNVSGLEVSQIRRGDVVAYPGSYQPTTLLDVYCEVLPGAGINIEHNMEMKLFLAAAQRVVRVRVLGADVLLPGQAGWLQLRLDHALVAVKGDRFILRRPSPGITLGGGEVLDPHPMKRWRRWDQAVLTRLEHLHRGAPSDLIKQNLLAMGPSSAEAILERAGLPRAQALDVLPELINAGEVLVLGDDTTPLDLASVLVHRVTYDELVAQAVMILEDFHARHPLRAGMPLEEFRSKFNLEPKHLNEVIRMAQKQSAIIHTGKFVQSAAHRIVLEDDQEVAVEALLDKFAAAPFRPPSFQECVHEVGQELVMYLIGSGKIERISNEIVFDRQAYTAMLERIRDLITTHGSTTVAEVRDEFETTRKYALALMEHLDEIGITVREGDVRKLAG